MRRSAAVISVAAFLSAAAATMLSSIATAAPTFTFIEGNAFEGRTIYDTAERSTLVLTDTATNSTGTQMRVLDVATGRSIALPSFVGRLRHLSEDGARIVFDTRLALDPADNDLLDDVYSMALADQSDVRWISPGYPQHRLTPVATNSDGTIAVMFASFGGLGDSKYVVGGANGLQDVVTLPETDFQVHGLSDDGNIVLYSMFHSCGTEPNCVMYPLLQFDRRTGITTPRAIDATGAAVESTAAAMTGDGSCAAYVELRTRRIQRQCDRQAPETVDPGPALLPIGYRCSGITLSPDATTVSWLGQERTFSPSGFESAAFGLQRRTIGGTTEHITRDADGNATAHVTCFRLTTRGLVIATSSDTFTPGGAGISRVHLYGEVAVPPVPTTQPPTTQPPTTQPPVTQPPTTTAPPNPTTTLPPTTPPTSTVPPTTSTAPAVGSAGPTGAGVFTGRTPVRILDTRTGLGTSAGLPARGTSITIPIRGRHGVPTDATAVAVQLTATEGTGTGYVSLIPGGTQAGFTSNLNLDTDGETIANSAIVPIGVDGSITLYTNAASHAIVDLAGWWSPTSGAVSAGRFQPVGPVRMLDTRPESRVGHDGPKPTAGSTTTVQVTGRLGVPSTGVSAVVLNVTIADPESLGFVQAAPAATLQPGASSTVNVGRPGQVIAASTIVPVDAQGRIALYSQPSTHLIVDVAGWFTDASVAPGTDGMFVPDTSGISPRRLDTRPGSGLWNGPKPTAGQRFDLGANGQAIVGNITVVDTDGPGFVQLGPATTMTNGATSNINPTRAEETVANAFIVPVGGTGVGVFTSVGTHVIIDVSGFMTS